MSDSVPAWTLPRGIDPATAARVAHGGRAPDLRVHVLSSRADGITVQVTGGEVPVDRADVVLYLAERGLFEVLRRENWPGGRVLLTLGAWSRGTSRDPSP